MASETAITGPHQAIAVTTAAERFAAQLFDALWVKYRERVAYVRKYEEVVAAAGAKFVNDHIAFRTIAAQNPQAGLSSVSRIFQALDFRAAGSYQFSDKHLRRAESAPFLLGREPPSAPEHTQDR